MNLDSKRWSTVASFILFIGLCASVTFWALQLFKPVARPVAAPKIQRTVEIDPVAANDLFGGRAAAVVPTSNFQLKGVVVSRNPLESVAILVADGKPAVAVRVNAEASPGVVVKEVNAKYVLLSEGGMVKRVELPAVAQQIRVEPPVGTRPQEPVIQPPLQPNGVLPPPRGLSNDHPT